MKKFLLVFSLLVLAQPAEAIIMDLDTIVISASRLGEEQYEITGNVTVITKEQIQNSNAQHVSDVLKDTPGLFVFESGTSKARTIDIRGFGDSASRNILVLINGRKINSVDISGPNLFQVPINSVERIEIIRGGSSVLYGDNAVGGVVNIITKEGEGDFSGEVGAMYSSYDGNGMNVEVSGEEKGVSYYISSKYLDEKGYRTNSDVLTKDFNARVGYEPTDHFKFDVNVGWHKDNVGLPGGLNATEIVTLSRRGSANPDDYADTKDQFVRVTMEVTPWIDKEYLGDIVIDWSFQDRDVADLANSSFGDFLSSRDTHTDSVSAKYIFNKEVMDRDVDFVFGIDVNDTENDILSTGPFGDNDLTIHKKDYGIFGFLELELMENLYVNAGKRHHRAKYSFDQRDSNTYESRKPKETVAMGGLKYEYAEGSNVYVNFQETFRFLATDEWFNVFSGLNTNLDQQTGEQYEIGMKHNFNNKAVVSVTTYLMDLENEIFFDPTINAGFGDNNNYDRTRRKGIELSSRLDVRDIFEWTQHENLNKLEFFTNYTWQRPQFRDGNVEGKDIPMVPRHQTSHGIVTKIFKHYKFSLSGRYVGSRYAVNDTPNATPKEKAYYVVDGKIAFESKDFEVWMAVNNLFNRKYNTLAVKSPSSSVRDAYPAAEKSLQWGVNYHF